MRKILVSELQPGMRFTRPVYIDQNNMLVGSNVPVKESDIKRLSKWDIKEVETEGDIVGSLAAQIDQGKSNELDVIIDSYNRLLDIKERLVQIHDMACNSVTKAHTAIKNSRIFPTNELDAAVEQMIRILNENHNVFIFIHGLGVQKDPISVHSVNVGFYAVMLGIAMKYPKPKLKELGLGALMINAGMVLIPAYITHKQSDLTNREQGQIKSHPLYGYKAVKELGNFTEYSAVVSLQHHEQYDGKGYPRGMKGNEISEQARIVSIADNYVALVEQRSYRDRKFFYEAMKSLVSDGSKKFDPDILKIFIGSLSIYPIGSLVVLNRRGTGIVIGTIPNKPLRPIIKLIYDEKGNKIYDLEIVNLIEDQSLFIVKSLDEKDAGITIADML